MSDAQLSDMLSTILWYAFLSIALGGVGFILGMSHERSRNKKQ